MERESQPRPVHLRASAPARLAHELRLGSLDPREGGELAQPCEAGLDPSVDRRYPRRSRRVPLILDGREAVVLQAGDPVGRPATGSEAQENPAGGDRQVARRLLRIDGAATARVTRGDVAGCDDLDPCARQAEYGARRFPGRPRSVQRDEVLAQHEAHVASRSAEAQLFRARRLLFDVHREASPDAREPESRVLRITIVGDRGVQPIHH